MPTQNVSDTTQLSEGLKKALAKAGIPEQIALFENLKDVKDGNQGSVTTDGTEQVLFSDAVENFVWNMTKVVCKNMVNGDIVLLRIYDWDIVDGAYYIHDTVTLKDSQPQPDYFYPQFPAHRFKVTIQRTATGAGGDKTYDWERTIKTWSW